MLSPSSRANPLKTQAISQKLRSNDRIVLADIERGASSAAAAAAADRPDTPPSRKLTQCLVAGDANSDAKMLCMLLRKRGVQCDTAVQASQLVEMVRRNGSTYQAVFIDSELPGLSVSTARHSSGALPTVQSAKDAPAASENVLPQKGWAVKMMRQECGYKNMIFGLSGAMLEDDASDLLAAGADCVITKQLRGKQLDAVLQFIKVRPCPCPCRALPSPSAVPSRAPVPLPRVVAM